MYGIFILKNVILIFLEKNLQVFIENFRLYYRFSELRRSKMFLKHFLVSSRSKHQYGEEKLFRMLAIANNRRFSAMKQTDSRLVYVIFSFSLRQYNVKAIRRIKIFFNKRNYFYPTLLICFRGNKIRARKKSSKKSNKRMTMRVSFH